MAFDIDYYTYELAANRLLRDNDEIERYEKALNVVFEQQNFKYISNLCVGLDDKTEHYEVTYNVIHAIEDFYKRDPDRYISQIFKVIADSILIPHAKEWLEAIIKRLLNNSEARQLLKEKLPDSDHLVKQTINQVLLELINRNPKQFKDSASEILEVIK